MKLISSLLALLIMFSGCQKEDPRATVTGIVGTVLCKSMPGDAFKPAQDKSSLFIGGAVKTEQNSSAKLTFSDQSEMLVQADAYFEIGSKDSFGTQNSGGVIYRLQKQAAPAKIETPHGTTAVLGTVFRQDVSTDSVKIWVEEGRVSFTPVSGGAETIVTAGQKLVASKSAQILKPELVDPLEMGMQINPGNSGIPEFNRR